MGQPHKAAALCAEASCGTLDCAVRRWMVLTLGLLQVACRVTMLGLRGLRAWSGGSAACCAFSCALIWEQDAPPAERKATCLDTAAKESKMWWPGYLQAFFCGKMHSHGDGDSDFGRTTLGLHRFWEVPELHGTSGFPRVAFHTSSQQADMSTACRRPKAMEHCSLLEAAGVFDGVKSELRRQSPTAGPSSMVTTADDVTNHGTCASSFFMPWTHV